MKKFKNFVKTWATTGLILVGIALMMVGGITGCQKYIDAQGVTVTKLSDDATIVLDKASEIAPLVQDTLVGVGVAFPALLPVLGIVAGAIGAFTGAYKKYRPQLTKAQDTAILAGDTTKALVFALEQFKLTNSDDWNKLKVNIKDRLLDNVGPEALAIIETIVQSYYNEEIK